MSSQDLLVVGLKLLGVYFAVLGIAQLGTAVVAVMINGAWVLREGRILTFDERAVLDEAAAIAAEVREAAAPKLALADTAARYFQACG